MFQEEGKKEPRIGDVALLTELEQKYVEARKEGKNKSVAFRKAAGRKKPAKGDNTRANELERRPHVQAVLAKQREELQRRIVQEG